MSHVRFPHFVTAIQRWLLTAIALLTIFCLSANTVQAQANSGWEIDISYTGTATCFNYPTLTGSDTDVGQVNGQSLTNTNSPFDLSQLQTWIAYSGHTTAHLAVSESYSRAIAGNDVFGGVLLTGAHVLIKLTWIPKSGQTIVTDPPPIAQYVRIFGKVVVNVAATGVGQSSLGSISDISAIMFTNGSDEKDNYQAPEYDVLVNVDATGIGTTSLPIGASMGYGQKGVMTAYNGQLNSDIYTSVGVVGFAFPRWGPSGTPLGGNSPSNASDPSFTRWLPLSFSPHITSQPFRTQAGAITAPWGNIDCYYSMMLKQEFTTPNHDLDGQSLLYSAIPGSDGTLNGIPPTFATLAGPIIPQFVITDANGTRVIFDNNYAPYANVHSTLTHGVGYTSVLSNAGPPGAIKEKGNYTYTFHSPDVVPEPPHLISIQDDLGNTQTLAWNLGGDPFLTVTDSSSGRKLLFHANATGYISAVEAPDLTGGTIHTHTALTMDGGGHLTAINVFSGGGQLLHTDTFGYGGPNGDSITSQQQGVSTASFLFIGDTLVPDPFNLATPRLSSATYGGTETVSSDTGTSIAGTFAYTYGPYQQGYNSFGVDAHTNTTIDARGNTFKTIFGLANGNSGAINSLTNLGPTLTGAALGTNQSKTLYSPNIDQPSSVTEYDPLYMSGVNSNPWYTSFDGLGNLTGITDPLQHKWTFAFTTDGKELASKTDPTGVTTNYTYGENSAPASRLTMITDGATGTLNIAYNSFGQPSTLTTPALTSASGLLETTTLFYNIITGDCLGYTDPLGDQSTVNGYDALGDPLAISVFPDTGNPTTSTGPLTTQFTWDAAQMPTQTLLPNGLLATNSYVNGILTSTQWTAPAAMGSTVLAQKNTSYDSRGRVYQTGDLLGVLGQYKYDRNSNLTKVIDGNGHTTTFIYGANNEPTNMMWSDGHETYTYYDEGGRVRQKADERGVVSNYTYDAGDRVTDIQWPTTPAENVHYTYDDAGRLLTASDSSGGRVYTYDVLGGIGPLVSGNAVGPLSGSGRLLSVVTTYAGLPVGHNTFTVSYTYCNDGHLKTVTTPVGISTYAYNVGGQTVQLTDAHNNVTNWSYDHANRLTSQSTKILNGATFATAYGYGASGISGDPSTAPAYLKTMTQTVNGAAFWKYTLKTSLLGQLLSQTGLGSTSVQNSTGTYTYDTRGRLKSQSTRLQTDSTHTYTNSGTYAYDAANNLKPSSSWTYNQNNQLTAAPASQGLAGATGLSYDASGNLATMNGMTLSYDCWGHMTSVANTASGTVSFSYDSSGRRVSKTVGTTTQFYVWDGRTLVGQTDSSGNVTRDYTFGETGVVSDHASTGGSADRMYASDPQGDTTDLIDGGSGGKLGPNIIPSVFGPPTGWPAPPATDVGVWVGGGGLLVDKELHGVGSTGSDYGIIVRSADGGRPYVPGLGSFGTPGMPGGFGGGGGAYGFGGDNPIGFGGADSAGNESPDAGMNDSSDWGSYGGMFGAVNTGAGHAAAVATTLASFIPLEGLREVLAGNDAMGKKISGLDRGLTALGIAAPFLHAVAPGLKGIKALDGLAKDVNKVGEAAEDVAKATKGGTYKLVDEETGEVVRTGRSNNLGRRAGEHQRDPKLGGYGFEVDRKTDSYAAQRGREQIIHDQYKPRLNKREPISPRNPRRGGYLGAGRKL